eukprot:m.113785 g.113785  ORF g.113785 m.113785 type:complete len:504 (-) comp19329_c0_seq3:256-1767(-)
MQAMLWLLLALALPAFANAKQPHIVFIVADDLGWNDVQFHGSPQIPTPNIDKLAQEGVILNNYHAQPVCSPTRASILSGRHVIHTGIYMPFSQGTALRLNLTYSLLPQYLQRLNYSTHAVGKWHLGQNVLKSLPTSRGFETFLGYWSGAEDYYVHTTKGGYDFEDNLRTAFEYNNTYSTYAFTSRAVDIIKSFNPQSAKPLFLYLAYQNVHWPLEAPQSYIDKFKDVPDQRRQLVCAMANILDDAIGNVTQALQQAGIMDDTLIIFTADNGGPTNGNEGTMSNNMPLRGGKNTLWEGGTRVAAFVHGAGLQKSGYVNWEKMHATDWLPTLVSMAAGEDWHKHIPPGEPAYLLGDGMDVWSMLRDGSSSPRTEILKECHQDHQPLEHGNALIVGDWKLIQMGMNPEPGWYPPPGQNPNTTHYTLTCGPPPAHADPKACQSAFCLFNVTADPCEYHNVADQFPHVVAQLTQRLSEYQATAVPPVAPEGCTPIIDKQGAWRPCDAP